MATAKVDQGGNKSNNVCSLPSQISKISNKISQKINPQKSSKDFDVQNPERSSATKPPRTATHGHKFPATYRFLIQICTNLRIFFTKLVPWLDPSTSDLQNPGKSTTKVQPCAPKQSHDLSNDPRPSPSNMCKSTHDFGKLTIPWSSIDLDRQSPKKFETKEAAMRLWQHRRS